MPPRGIQCTWEQGQTHVPNREPNPEEQARRERLVEELRRRYIEGTLDDVLIPDDVDIQPLLDELRREEPGANRPS